ncbi:MAG: hypothetical protein WA718_12545 [Terriglobales bacterium]
MGRLTGALLLAGYVTLQGWALVSQGQTQEKQVAAPEQKAANQGQPEPASSAAATTNAQFPLDRFQNFSAIQNGGPLPGMDVDRYIYRSGKLMRMQGDASVPEYNITDLVKQQSHVVSSHGCLETGTPYKLSFPFFVSGPGVTYEHIPIGEETVDGHQCHVEDVIIHSPKNPVVVHFRFYEADDLQGFPVKIENRREHAYPWVIHYKEVRLGPPDPSLFLIPDKCETAAGFKKAGAGSKPKAPSPKPQ